MYILTALSAFVFLIIAEVESRECKDCINYNKCPVALDLALNKRDETTKNLFKEASCGFDHSGNKPIPKVCCSDFSSKEVDKVETTEDTRISNHANLKLLPSSCGGIQGDRIIGGKEANLYEFPWMVLISHRTTDGLLFKCGGSIINSRYVLTAAHCVYKKLVAGVRVGEHDISNEYDCRNDVCENHIQDIPVEKSVIHEKYMSWPQVIYDIALLRVAEPIEFGHKNVDAICLPKTSQLRKAVLDNQLAIIAGWGYTENMTLSSVLLKAPVPIRSAEDCNAFINEAINPGEEPIANRLCAGELNKDSCGGDSGGPLILEGVYNGVKRYVQYGIVSFGPKMCGSSVPGVYTDVTKFMGWILDNMEPL